MHLNNGQCWGKDILVPEL